MKAQRYFHCNHEMRDIHCRPRELKVYDFHDMEELSVTNFFFENPKKDCYS